METNVAPPLGLIPREIWEKSCRSARLRGIFEACIRYTEVDKPIPVAWILELRDLWAEYE